MGRRGAIRRSQKHLQGVVHFRLVGDGHLGRQARGWYCTGFRWWERRRRNYGWGVESCRGRCLRLLGRPGGGEEELIVAQFPRGERPTNTKRRLQRQQTTERTHHLSGSLRSAAVLFYSTLCGHGDERQSESGFARRVESNSRRGSRRTGEPTSSFKNSARRDSTMKLHVSRDGLAGLGLD